MVAFSYSARSFIAPLLALAVLVPFPAMPSVQTATVGMVSPVPSSTVQLEKINRPAAPTLVHWQPQQMLSVQRELQALRHENELQKLQSEKAQLAYLSVIALLSTLLLLTLGFGAFLRKRHAQLRTFSEIDPLTGLNNRRSASLALDSMMKQQSVEDTRHVMFLIDIDHFKKVNDTFGHHVGDDVLTTVAARLKAACRPSDIVARWGGEEFLVACPNLSREQAELLATRLRQAMAYTLNVGEQIRPITVSLGMAPVPFFDERKDKLTVSHWDYALRMADRALYAAKRTRDAWVGYWGAQPLQASIAEAVLDDPERYRDLITVMASQPRLISLVQARPLSAKNKRKTIAVPATLPRLVVSNG